MIIYKATNKINGKVYVGQTRHSLETRKLAHLRQARNGRKPNRKRFDSIKWYREDGGVYEKVTDKN